MTQQTTAPGAAAQLRGQRWQPGVMQLDGVDYLTLSYDAAVAATDVESTVEISVDLAAWRSGDGEVSFFRGDGTSTYVYRRTTAIPPSQHQFMRLRLTLRESLAAG